MTLDDGGRHLSDHYDEESDCTVRALTIVTGLPYDIVHAELRRAGRHAKRGFELTDYLSHRRKFLGRAFASVRFRRKTVMSDILKSYPRGRHVVDLDDHVLAFVDGCAHDLMRVSPDERVLGIWSFTSTGDSS